jgi:hypothetical protein
VAALVAGGLALLAAPVAVVARRRRRVALMEPPALAELRRALSRSGRPAPPGLTLRRVEQLVAGSPAAGDYVRALSLERYGVGAAPPTPAQRRALRRELGRGLGVRGRLRALWALPPRAREVADALSPRRPRAS